MAMRKVSTGTNMDRFCFLLFICCFFLRPTMLGDGLSIVGSVFVFLAGFYVFAHRPQMGPYFGNQMLCQGSAVVMWFALLVHATLNGLDNYYPLSGFIQVALSSVGGIICFSHKDIHDKFFSIFRSYLELCALSYIVTIILSVAVGISALRLGSIPTKNYDVSDLYFPFTISYGFKDYFGLSFPRASAGFRESGIAQAFYACAILTIPNLQTMRGRVSFLLLSVGGLAALSTTGIGIVGIAIAVRLVQIQGIKWYIRLIGCLIGIYFAYLVIDFAINDDTIGFAAKADTESYFDRLDQTNRGLQNFFNNPWGYGIYSERGGGGINLIAALGALGISGAFFVLSNVVCSVIGARFPIQKMMFVLPLFPTSLTSQPLLDAGLVYLFYGYAGEAREGGVRRPSEAYLRRRQDPAVRYFKRERLK